VVQDLRDVGHPPRPLRHPEQEIPVLAAVESASHTADRAHELGPVHGEVAHVVEGHEQAGRPPGLEERVDVMAGGVQAILVGVDEIEARLRLQARRDLVEGVGREFVVVIQEGHELPPGELQGA
jgi:hypothetical protein